MRRLNASDDRWICIETEQNTFQIGALLLFEADATHAAGDFAARALEHFRSRLPATPLAVRLVEAPAHLDTGVWVATDDLDVDQHVQRAEADEPMVRSDVNHLVSRQVLVPWNRDQAPFHATILDRLAPEVADARVAGSLVGLILQTHHSVADGVGFQAIIEDLTDPSPGANPPAVHGSREHDPNPVWWAVRSAARLGLVRARYALARGDRRRAAAELAALRAQPDWRRARTPEVPGMAVAGSADRAYERMTLPLSGMRTIGRAFGGTVNDALMAVVAGAVRRLLVEWGALESLGDRPLVALVPRSTRTGADGRYGNHLTMMLPQLATDVADPRERFERIRQSMQAEKTRSELSERLAPLDDRPFAARRRRNVTETGTSAGNISISNVPGPSEPRFLAGYRMLANYPVPNVVDGQFLNVTLRRYLDDLHLGLMSDVVMMGAPGRLVSLLEAEFGLMHGLAAPGPTRVT